MKILLAENQNLLSPSLIAIDKYYRGCICFYNCILQWYANDNWINVQYCINDNRYCVKTNDKVRI